jgi:hypothetical protein
MWSYSGAYEMMILSAIIALTVVRVLFADDGDNITMY